MAISNNLNVLPMKTVKAGPKEVKIKTKGRTPMSPELSALHDLVGQNRAKVRALNAQTKRALGILKTVKRLNSQIARNRCLINNLMNSLVDQESGTITSGYFDSPDDHPDDDLPF